MVVTPLTAAEGAAVDVLVQAGRIDIVPADIRRAMLVKRYLRRTASERVMVRVSTRHSADTCVPSSARRPATKLLEDSTSCGVRAIRVTTRHPQSARLWPTRLRRSPVRCAPLLSPAASPLRVQPKHIGSQHAPLRVR